MKKTLLALALLGSASLVHAASLGVTATPTDTAIDTRNFTFGWSFSIADPIRVLSLGYYDDQGNGLLSSHEVGIFNSTGSLVASTTVGSGTSGVLQGGWRFSSIAPVLLSAGTYTIAAQNNSSGDPMFYITNSVTPGPGISIINQAIYSFGSGLLLPSTVDRSGLTFYQPNFQYEATSSPVPEPGTAALFLTAAGFALTRLRRRS